jgi:SAM-dependent methyltransferase
MSINDTININCAFCNSSESTPYDKEGDWTIVKCNSCNFLYTNPRPTIESLPSFYEEEYFKDKRHVSKFYNPDGTIKQVQVNYTNRIEDIEHFAGKRGRLLEIGSARGGFLSLMKTRGWDVQGVEISADAGQKANDSGITTFVGVYTDFNEGNKFDSICMYQTLEHVPDPKEIILKAFEDLNPGGTLIVEVPNVKCFEQKVNKTRRHLSYDLPRHLNHFSHSFLMSEFKKAGFDTIRVDLYPPKFLLKLMSIIEARKANKMKPVAVGRSEEKVGQISLMKKSDSKKAKIIQSISRIFPGWRLTITGIKS